MPDILSANESVSQIVEPVNESGLPDTSKEEVRQKLLEKFNQGPFPESLQYVNDHFEWKLNAELQQLIAKTPLTQVIGIFSKAKGSLVESSGKLYFNLKKFDIWTLGDYQKTKQIPLLRFLFKESLDQNDFCHFGLYKNIWPYLPVLFEGYPAEKIDQKMAEILEESTCPFDAEKIIGALSKIYQLLTDKQILKQWLIDHIQKSGINETQKFIKNFVVVEALFPDSELSVVFDKIRPYDFFKNFSFFNGINSDLCLKYLEKIRNQKAVAKTWSRDHEGHPSGRQTLMNNLSFLRLELGGGHPFVQTLVREHIEDRLTRLADYERYSAIRALDYDDRQKIYSEEDLDKYYYNFKFDIFEDVVELILAISDENLKPMIEKFGKNILKLAQKEKDSFGRHFKNITWNRKLSDLELILKNIELMFGEENSFVDEIKKDLKEELTEDPSTNSEDEESRYNDFMDNHVHRGSLTEVLRQYITDIKPDVDLIVKCNT